MFNSSEEVFDKKVYLTRLSYDKADVYVSLYFSVLDKRFDESMFWSYELMRSGFIHELIEFYMTLHFDFFYMFNEGFEEQIQAYYEKIIELLKQEQTQYIVSEIVHIVANIVYNFVVRPFSVLSWLKKQYDVDINVKVESTDYTRRFKEKIPETNFRNMKTYLYNYAKYAVRKRETVFMRNTLDTNVENYVNWFSGIQHTPYWKEVISHYGGKLEKTNEGEMEEMIIFPSCLALEDFIDAYYPEFDNMDLHEKLKYGIVENEAVEYFEKNKMTWQEFYQKYYYDITQDERLNSLFSSFDGIGL